ncbi:uncharacterized protein LOC133181534 [Saccostrea echinata]|uniref:uncharacterized protein LOC133181534 n=1 Tax=Saccostrea echinata TaxID=191078 RepID=UPI002A83D379|nr:uncharacterized protein LOC133181534 [Saccostrea echinata]
MESKEDSKANVPLSQPVSSSVTPKDVTPASTREPTPAGPVKCSTCPDDVTAAFFCDQCQKYYCRECRGKHANEVANGAKHKMRDISTGLTIDLKQDDTVSAKSTPRLPFHLQQTASPETISNFRVKEPLPNIGHSVTKKPARTENKQLVPKFQRERSEAMTPRSQLRRCFSHPSKDVQLHCLECNKIVCSECIVEGHQRHQFVSISEAATKLRGELQSHILPVKTWYESDARTAMTNLNLSEETYTKKSQECIDIINKRAEQLHKDIDRVKNALVEDVESKNSIDLEEYRISKEGLEDQMKSTEEVIGNIEMAINDAEDISILRSENDLRSMISSVDMKIQIQEAKPPIFYAGSSTDERIRELFGHNHQEKPVATVAWSLQAETLKPTRDLDLIRVSSIPCADGQPLHTMVPLGESEVWMSSLSNPKQIQLVGVDGSMEKPGEFDFVIRDLAISRNGDLFMSCFDTRCIKRLRLNGTLETFFNASPLHPQGIHMSRSGVLLACLVDSPSTDGRQIRPYSKRQLVKITKSGRIMKRLAFSIDIRLFTSPLKVAETVEEEICVIDKTAKDRGRVIVFTRNEQVKFIYTGPVGLKMEYMFCPTDLTCDIYGHVIVTDANNNAIHMIDKHGQVLRVHQIGRDWIDVPHSVVVDNKGLMIVGDSAGMVHIIRYLK